MAAKPYSYMIELLGLSLSTECNARCIYCPKDRANSIPVKRMKPELIEKILDDIISRPDAFSISKVSCGENGDAFTNPQALDCLRIIKAKLPNAIVCVNTNFDTLTGNISEAILEEDLIGSITFNIDGSTPENYYLVKRLDYEKVSKNILYFIQLRKALNKRVPITLLSIPYRRYVNCVNNNFGFLPTNLAGRESYETKNDFKAILNQWRPALDLSMDRICQVDAPFAWAEREQIYRLAHDDRKFICPRIWQVKHIANIAPDGSWYLCDLDANYDYIIGNAADTNIGDLALSERRMRAIRNLEARRFSEIGPPCNSVQACQYLLENRFASKLLLAAQRNKFTRAIAYSVLDLS